MLSFIGVNVMKTDIGFMFGIRHKTHSGLYINFRSNLPDTYKKVAFTGSLFRIPFTVSGLSLLMSLLNYIKCLLSIFTLHNHSSIALNIFCLKSTIHV